MCILYLDCPYYQVAHVHHLQYLHSIYEIQIIFFNENYFVYGKF